MFLYLKVSLSTVSQPAFLKSWHEDALRIKFLFFLMEQTRRKNDVGILWGQHELSLGSEVETTQVLESDI